MTTTPVNRQAGDDWYDHKIYVAKLIALTKSAEDLSSVFSNAFVADIDGQNTTTVSVRLRPELTLADLPADAEGLANPAYTSVSGGSVDITLGAGKFYNVPVDTLGVKPAQATSEFADAAGRAVLGYGNSELIAGIVAGGTQAFYGSTFDPASATAAQELWGKLLDEKIAIKQGEMNPSEFVVDIDTVVWTTLQRDIKNLNSAVDALATAAKLLGVSRVREVNMPTGALFAFSHVGAVAQAKVTQGPRTQETGFIKSVLGAIKATTKVLVPAAVRVTMDGVAV